MDATDRWQKINDGKGLLPLGSWLDEELDTDEYPDLEDPEQGDTAVNGTIDSWLAEFAKAPQARSPWHSSFRFPPDVREQYLAIAHLQEEKEISELIRNFLVPQGLLNADRRSLEYMTVEDLQAPPTEYHRRLLRFYLKLDTVTPHEGLSWILDLLPWSPQQALMVVNAYLAAHFWDLPDGRIDGLLDVMALIRAFYASASAEQQLVTHVAVLLGLGSRGLENLVEDLYHHLEYETTLTPPRRDGGRDVIATRVQRGRHENPNRVQELAIVGWRQAGERDVRSR